MKPRKELSETWQTLPGCLCHPWKPQPLDDTDELLRKTKGVINLDSFPGTENQALPPNWCNPSPERRAPHWKVPPRWFQLGSWSWCCPATYQPCICICIFCTCICICFLWVFPNNWSTLCCFSSSPFFHQLTYSPLAHAAFSSPSWTKKNYLLCFSL